MVKQYEYNANSDDSDGEQKLLEGLGQEMGLVKMENAEKAASGDLEPIKGLEATES